MERNEEVIMDVIIEFLWWLLRDYLWRPMLVMLGLFIYAELKGLDDITQPFMYISLGFYIILEICLIFRKIRNR
jgi:hypothetical protein